MLTCGLTASRQQKQSELCSLSAVCFAQGASASQERRGRQRYTARCHVHDICSVIQASISHPNPGSIYNIVDDEPAPRLV